MTVNFHHRRWIIFLILIISLIFIGIIYETVSEASEARAYPPPGKMVDIGGYLLHLNCTGTGSPTVVIEAGLGEFSASWSWVQPGISKITRVCTYDRAGMGWSEASNKPRTAREFANELHTLLEKSYEQGPYVLAGHSLGGYTIRVYAHDYPDEVAGLVLIDPQNILETNLTPPKITPNPSKNSLVTLIAKLGVIRLLGSQLGSIQNLPQPEKQAYTALSVTPGSTQTFYEEARGISEGAAQARAITNLNALPIIVLSRGKDMDAESAASQSRYLHLSSNSVQLVASQSGHSIMIEQPSAAIDAILQMVELVRQNTLKSN